MTTFVATSWDGDKAVEAMRKLCQAYEDGEANGAHMDVGDVGTALTLAVEAFPGLQEHLSAAEDPDAVLIDIRGLGEAALGPVLDTACSLALIGARAELGGGFRWEDIDLNWEMAKGALATLPEPPRIR